jgi:hypothetical protein
MPRTLLLLLCLVLQKQPAANKQGAQEQVKKPPIDQPATETRQSNSEAVVKQVRPVESQIPANDHKEQDRAQRVKEINDTLLVVFTGLLFVVGALQAAAIFRQEKWMRENVGIAKEAADAALLNAQAAIAAARPWVSIFAIYNGEVFTFKAENLGNTPAEVVSYASGMVLVDRAENLPVPPIYALDA